MFDSIARVCEEVCVFRVPPIPPKRYRGNESSLDSEECEGALKLSVAHVRSSLQRWGQKAPLPLMGVGFFVMAPRRLNSVTLACYLAPLLFFVRRGPIPSQGSEDPDTGGSGRQHAAFG